MLKKTSVAALVLVLLAAAIPGYSGSREEKDAPFALRLRESLTKLGTGPNARIEVRLRDNTRLKGYVAEASDDYFVVMDSKTGAATKVPYPQVKKVSGNNLSTGVKIALGIGLAIGILLIFIGIANGNG
jgi:hypothetical protein